MSNITIFCHNCNTSFSRSKHQVKYQAKRGKKTFCSLSCSTQYANINQPKVKSKIYDISLHSNNRKDQYTGLREFITRINNRAAKDSRFIKNSLTLDDLLAQWKNQNGLCPYTGLQLELPGYKKKYTNKLAKASLDRIDSSNGYVVGNIQFVSVYINYLKSDLDQSEFETLINLIRK